MQPLPKTFEISQISEVQVHDQPRSKALQMCPPQKKAGFHFEMIPTSDWRHGLGVFVYPGCVVTPLFSVSVIQTTVMGGVDVC